MTESDQIVVVGSANLDVVVPVEKLPSPGETVLGGDHLLVPGGKGANQAVAAARLGADVTFIGSLGNDWAQPILLDSLAESGVDTTWVQVAPDTPSGLALIAVERSGENTIVVSPGSNYALTPERIADCPLIERASVVLLQLEIPIETVVSSIARSTGFTILDPAPAPPKPLPPELIAGLDLIVPNETELASLCGLDRPVRDLDHIESLARSLGVPCIVSLGARGALIVERNDSTLIDPPRIKPVDTTGAGDAFRAAIAHLVAMGEDLKHAVRFAVRAGAATALVEGAQTSLPTQADIVERLPTG